MDAEILAELLKDIKESSNYQEKMYSIQNYKMYCEAEMIRGNIARAQRIERAWEEDIKEGAE